MLIAFIEILYYRLIDGNGAWCFIYGYWIYQLLELAIMVLFCAISYWKYCNYD